MRAASWLAVAVAVAIAACGDGGEGDDGDDGGGDVDAAPTTEDVCSPTPGEGVFFDPDDLCDRLSSYRFFADVGLAPNDGVVPYDLTSTLFSDYSVKVRHVYVPDGQTIAYDEVDSFDLPVGAVVLKTFSFPADLRAPEADVRVVETRLMVRTATGFKGVTYVWNDDQTDATRKLAGAALPISFVHTDGETRELAYIVPNENQCKECHEEVDGVLGLVGPKARHLNRDFDYGGDAGVANQLQHWSDLGILTGAPADPGANAPRTPVFDDPATGTLEERARAYLEINCAHCHNPEGRARTSGLNLRFDNPDLLSYGVCKPPVAAGGGSGGLQYNIVPGAPDDSILVFRMESTEPDVQMPELGRALVHAEGVAIVREWIASLAGTCDVEPPP